MKEAQPTVRPVIGRLAPSPTGYLHLGNAWAFLCAWLGARSAGGRLILRIEDIDPQRSKTELIHALREDLRWLGLDWDAGPGQENLDAETPEPGPYLQSLRLKRYAGALAQLERRGLAYQCFCTRKELRSMAGAPQAGDAAEGVYTGRCRGFAPEERAAWLAQGRAFSWRLRFQENLRPEFLRFRDLVYGEIELKPEKAGGDFAICRSAGVYAYQLAVALDDIAM